ncbi:MAG: hypothetical protein K2X38_02780 [Gemmataceae bacterium]|nr:hypothetical protein [Gemmataceae bacterium]
MNRFDRNPSEFFHSREYFRSLALLTVLRRDCGIRYNPDVMDESAPFTPAESFVHGALIGNGGSCASMPVIFVAVGRMLGYPLKLVSAKGARFTHLIARWDEAKIDRHIRFNIEATSQGLSCNPDDYYRIGRYELDKELERRGRFLVSKSPREELACFLMERGWCFHELGGWRRKTEAFAWALGLAPENDFYRNTLFVSINGWKQEIVKRKPRGFPELQIESPFRRFPRGVPLEAERDIFATEATENLLNNPELERDFWAPMRQNKLSEVPKFAVADFHPSGNCRIRFQGRTTLKRNSEGGNHV